MCDSVDVDSGIQLSQPRSMHQSEQSKASVLTMMLVQSAGRKRAVSVGKALEDGIVDTVMNSSNVSTHRPSIHMPSVRTRTLSTVTDSNVPSLNVFSSRRF